MGMEFVIGVDGGGTRTRVMVADRKGRVLALVEGGGSNPQHHPRAEENALDAIREALAAAGCAPEQVVSLVAGFAGLDDAEDESWAERHTAAPGLTCRRLHVNDAVIAHAGALRSTPGIIAISGTGSVVFGVTEEGRRLRNYDFRHYARSAARHLAYEAVWRIIAGEAGAEDQAFVGRVLAFWGAADLAELREIAAGGFSGDQAERTYRFGEMAPLVTAAALDGVPLARAVCDQAAAFIVLGIRLVGSCFTSDTIPVALVGAAIRSAYMTQAVTRALALGSGRYQVVEPALSSVEGAVLMALREVGLGIGTPPP